MTVFFLTAASAASAQFGGSIGLFTDAEGTDCTTSIGLVELHVIHYGHSGAIASEFAITPIPVSWVYLAGDVWDYPAIGDAINGVAVSYGSCVGSPTHLGTVHFMDIGVSTCEEVGVGPAPGNFSVESYDCASVLKYPGGDIIRANCGLCGVRPPYNLLPADGTEAVSTSPTLSWSYDYPTGCVPGIGITIFTVFMGTEPDNLTEVSWVDGETELAVGPLQPGTTYYWQVSVYEDNYICPGERGDVSGVQSFTTEGPVPAKLTTWGRIKSLYR
jgi:hypothetical protein